MGNKHVKIINGRRYYYESIRKGKRVMSKYLGPVDERKRKPKRTKEDLVTPVPQQRGEEAKPEETYIG